MKDEDKELRVGTVRTQLWVMYTDGVPSGCAMGPDADTIFTSMRAQTLGMPAQLNEATGEPVVLTAKLWRDAPIEDCVRGGLGMLMWMTIMQQAAGEAMMAAQQKGRRH